MHTEQPKLKEIIYAYRTTETKRDNLCIANDRN